MKLRVPTPVAVDRALNTLLEGHHWPSKVSLDGVYVRRHDDTDGKTGPEEEVSLAFSRDGDVWLMLPGMSSLRFRTLLGGGQSLRVRNALLVLAEAIRRDNEENPQKP